MKTIRPAFVSLPLPFWGIVLAAILLLGTSPRPATSPETRMLGFLQDHGSSERALEARFDSSLHPENLRAWMKRIAARPHHLGSAYDKQNAEFIASLYSSWGFETIIEEFHPLFPTPKQRLLELIGPDHYTAGLSEPALPEDSTSNQQSEQLPTYNAYSIDGDVTGDLVYVNYGIPADYEELDRHGIDVKGKIVIARYGGSWRGIKPKVAAEHGAVGCIIYSDPRDDGYFEGDAYPKGAYRSDRGAQRGSVADIPIYSGDPSTPFVGATEKAKHLAVKDIPTLTKIPVLPISYGDALPFLKALNGPVAPEEWRGALPITYHLGPGPARVHLALSFSWDIVSAYDVIAKLKGTEFPDEWVIRGNHHDAWVNGASDPVSGQVATLEEGRAIGALVKTGWHPRRTIIYCAWDGEEPGLVGSTEWVETHAKELQEHAIAYVNSDGNGRGFLGVGGSPSLEQLVNEAAREVIDPEKDINVVDRARAQRIVESQGDDRRESLEHADLRIFPLGSGSDYTPFLQHLGIPSLNIGYGGENDGGEYHSIYDSYDHYVRFDDSTFEYGATLAKTGGRIILRLADADVIPFEFTGLAETVGKFSKEVSKLADDMRTGTEEQSKMIRERMYEAASDPKDKELPPPLKDPVPFLNFAPLQNAVSSLKKSADEFDSSRQAAGDPAGFSVSARRQIDAALMRVEPALTSKDGLPRRPWYVHMIYAPGFYTGYGVKTLPGIREAIEQRNWKEATDEIDITAQAISRCAERIGQAANAIREATK